MIRAFLESLLASQLRVKPDEWARKHPHAWLVWEPGEWKAAARNQTMVPVSAQATSKRPMTGDALCFELETPEQAARTLKVGRAPENDIAINDATVSRNHFSLSFDKKRWSITADPAGKPVTWNGAVLPPGKRTPLSDGAKIVAGGVTLTFLEPKGFLARLGPSPPGAAPT